MLVLIAMGVFLRIWRAGSMLIFGDEIHLLQATTSKSFSWILTHHFSLDACIPLTVYCKLILENAVLNEWLMRLPCYLAGAMTLVVFGWIAWKFLSRWEAVFSVGLFALSPYYIYLAREARPYAITTLFFGMAMLLTFSWARGGHRSSLVSSSILCALAIYFHLIIIPAVAVLALYPLVMIISGGISRERWRDYACAALIFAIVAMLLMVPPMRSLLQELGMKVGQGTAGLETFRRGLMIIHGLPIVIPIWPWILICIVGAWSLYRRYSRETICMLAMVAAQIGVIQLMQPNYMQVPWVWIRYSAHVHPIIIVFVASGLAFIMSIPKKVAWNTMSHYLLPGVLICFFAYHLCSGNYNLSGAGMYNAHPQMLFAPRKLDDAGIKQIIPRFYRDRLPSLPPGSLIEAPMLVTFPLYQFYHTWHGRKFITGTLGDGYGQALFGNNAGIRFKSNVPVNNSIVEVNRDARYLIVHKRIKAELADAFHLLRREMPLATQIDTLDFLFEIPVLDSLFGKEDLSLSHLNWPFDLIYEDDMVAVYDLKGA